MFQVEVKSYASDALEDAMRLAQTKAINSYSWSDMLNYLNYAWMDIYQRINQMDDGYYSRTVQITKRLTRLPPFLKNTIHIYAAQRPVGHNHETFIASGYNDLQGRNTYHISGFDLYCPDAEHRTVWLNYIPMQQQIFFTRNNRDPKLYDAYLPRVNAIYNMYILEDVFKDDGLHHVLKYRIPGEGEDCDITETLYRGEHWSLIYITCDFPYVFCSWRHDVTGEHQSGFFKNINTDSEYIIYNPFEFTGRNSNVEYLDCKWNDKTGMGVILKDHNDNGQIKELGWTPDSLLIYPAPEAYRLLVAQLADKLSALNESSVMGVTKELVEARFAFDNFLKKDKSAWYRITNVTGPTIGDTL
jgi:hypothetical protein